MTRRFVADSTDFGLWAALAAVPIGLFVLFLWMFRGFVADDAYIVGRYALNAADGLGLVYNPGERVTALTSPLHALLLSVAALFTDDPVRVYRWIAPGVLMAGAALAWRIAGLGLRGLAVFSVIAVAPPSAALWALGGLETPLLHVFMGVYTAIVIRIWRRGEAGPAEFLWLAVVAALAFLTRFDSILVTLPPLLALAAVFWRRTALWIAAAVGLVMAGGWLFFSFFYYGEILPTSAFVKLSAQSSYPGIYSLVLTLNLPLVTGLVLLLPFLGRGRAERFLRRALLRGAIVSAVLFLAYAVNVSSEHMMFGYRFFVPYLPVIGLLAACQAPRIPALALVAVLGLDLGVGVRMANFGTNFVPLAGLPGGARLTYEWDRWTPRSYAKTIRTFEASAAEVRAHWDAQGRSDRPNIFLWAGGAGYWLRNFYVFETLVSYRRQCQDFIPSALLASHYAQDVPLGFESGHAAYLARRPDIGAAPVVLSAASERILGEPRISYTFGPSPADWRLPPRVGLPCTPPPKLPSTERRASLP